jgi:HlyD family secretion protein
LEILNHREYRTGAFSFRDPWIFSGRFHRTVLIMRKLVFFNIVAVFAMLAATAGCGTFASIARLQKSDARVPVVRVVREPVEVKIYTIGELRPARTAMITAPPVAGGTLQIVEIVRTGALVKQGDIVVQFDPSEQEYNLEQSKSQLEEADQQIKKMKADQSVRVAQEHVSLLKAQYEVQRAELKVKGNEVLSAIEARKNVISLEEAKRKLEQLQRDIKSRASSDAADLAVQNVARTKAMLGMKLAQQNIDNMTCRAPISGIVVLGQNLESLMSASGSISISDETEIPEYRQGDQAYPGRLVANIQDVEQMEIAAKIIETDRGSIEAGQSVEVTVDSKPLKTFKGKIKSLAQSASSTDNDASYVDYLEGLSTRSFATIFEVDAHGDPLNLGATARVTIMGKDVRDALSIPRQALHQKEGKPVVYTHSDDGWESREVRIRYLTESRAVIDGIAEGTEVALINPDQKQKKAGGKSSPLASILGGAAQ